MNKSIALTGGGTAGHVWPNFALFDTPSSPLSLSFEAGELDVHYFGSQTGLERDLVQSTMPKWHYHGIATGKLRRYFSIKNFFDPLRIVLGCWQSFWLLRKIKPSVVFSKGGFVSAPVVWAAWVQGIPVVIHESDATPALATRLTSICSKKILCAFPQSSQHFPQIFQKKIIDVGLPLRHSLFQSSKLEGLAYFNFQNDKNVILVFGGSLGAKQLNLNILEVLPKLCEKYHVIHITGKNNHMPFSHENYKQFEFLKNEMKYAYAAADLAICRAGASSIFELAAARIPMILIPLGLEASRGDQIINANIFTQKNWAESFTETQFKKDVILQAVENHFKFLSDKQKALQTAPSLDAAHKVACILNEYIYPSQESYAS